ncbi:putative ribonuclease H-like domain-containing protein [Tanacetum coccineum]|uniref:Ribonuclease H-like domain-containing protein n=1 Tax=Tanacetum coccineum TaxID=301880 RepID=A0ABQ5HAB1_9ASTR
MNFSPIPTTRIHKDHPKDQIIGEINSATQTRRMTMIYEEHALMDVKSAFLYGTIEEEVYVCQPPGFEDPQFPDKVYKVEKALYGLHQAPRAWYETLSTYLLENGFRRGTIDKTLFIKKDKGDILLVQVYVDDIIFGSTKKSLCVEFEQMMHKRFQMSSMGELTFFLGLQVKQKDDGIFISQDKYVVDVLKKFDFVTVKIASTLIETNKALLKDEEAEDVDVHLYRSMIGSLMYLKASRPDIMFAVCACARFQVTPKVSHFHAVKGIFRYLQGQPKLGLWYPRDSPFDLEVFSDSDSAGASLDMKSTIGGCQFLGKRLISWQCKNQTIVSNSTTEVEYVAAANCYGQVLWIQNQMLNYGFNFMNTKIYTDNESTILWFEDGISDEFRVKTGSCKVNAARLNLVLLGEKPFNDTYETPKHTQKVFANMRRKGKGFSGAVTLLFQSMLVPQVVEGEGLGQPSEPQPPSPTAPPSQEEQVPAIATSHPQKTQTPRQAKRGRDTKIPQSGGPSKKVGDETIHKELGDRVEKAATTAASLDSEFERVPIPSYDSPLSGGNILGSDEERIEQDDLTDFIPPTPHDSPLSGGHTPGSDEDLVIKKLEKKVRKLEKKLRARTLGMKLFKIGISKRKSLDEEYNVEGDAETQRRNTAEQTTNAGDTVNTASIDVSAVGPLNVSTADPSTSTTGDIFKDEMMTIADTLVAIRSTRPRTTSVVIHDVEEEPKRATPIPIVQSQDKAQLEREQSIARERAAEQEAKDAALFEQMKDMQARMEADELLAERFQQEEREQFTIEEKSRMLVEMIAERKRFFVAQRAEQIRNKPPTRAQLRNKIVTYLKHMGTYTHNQMKNKSFKEIQKLYEREKKWTNNFVPIDSEVVKDKKSVKRQKIEDDTEKEVLRSYLDIISRDEEAVNVESLATKYLIVDWKTHALSEDKMYYEIIKGDGSTKSYKIFTEMLDDFDRQDVLDLYRLVKEKFETASLEGYDILL